MLFFFLLFFFFLPLSIYSSFPSLFTAVGVSGGAAKKIKRLSRETSARQQQHRRSAAAAAAEAEAVEALAEIASGPGITGSAAAESSSDN